MSSKALWTLLFGFGSFLVTFLVINYNLILQPSPSRQVKIQATDSAYHLDVHSFDTLKKTSKALTVDTTKTELPVINKDAIFFQLNPIFLTWITIVLMMETVAGSAFIIFLFENMELKKAIQLKNNTVWISFFGSNL